MTRMAAAASLVGRQLPTWMQYAACSGKASRYSDPWSPPDSAFYPPQAALEICESCPVRLACLADGLEHDDDTTVRGGLTHRQRRALKRPHVRATCPSCGQLTAPSVKNDGAQVCLTCGLSWITERKTR